MMTQKDSAALIEEFHVPKHVRRHCAQVAKLAVEIALGMQKNGVDVKIELPSNAALVHDLLRVVDFKTFEPHTWPDAVTQEEVDFWKKLRQAHRGRHHADVAADILQNRGFQAEAIIVREHRYLQIDRGFSSLESKIVYYADKRVKHDQIVSLGERLEDGRMRNAPHTIGTEKAREREKKVMLLEKELLSLAGMISE